MKTVIILGVIALFVLTLCYYLKECKKKDCNPSCSTDKRIDGIKRAQKNLHPTRNSGVDRDAKGRYCKKK